MKYMPGTLSKKPENFSSAFVYWFVSKEIIVEEVELLDSDDDNLPIQNTFIHKLSSILLDISNVFPDLISVKSSSKDWLDPSL